MRSVPLHVVRALQEGRRIAAKIEPKSQDAVAWVWVAPFKGDGLYPAHKYPGEPWKYMVQYFEAPKTLIDREFDIGPENLLHHERYEANTLDEVDDLLDRLVGDPSKFKPLAEFPDYFPF